MVIVGAHSAGGLPLEPTGPLDYQLLFSIGDRTMFPHSVQLPS